MTPRERDRARDAEVAILLAAARAAARHRNPDWRPWMRTWCTTTNFGERRGIGWRARADGIGRYGR